MDGILFSCPDRGLPDRAFRAEDEARTRDLNLGKVALYQLSYFRILFFLKEPFLS